MDTVTTLGGSPSLLLIAAGALSVLGGLAVAYLRQRAALARLEERMTHLSAGVSLLANTTEEGLQAVAQEIARLAAAAQHAAHQAAQLAASQAPPATEPPPPVQTPRQRITAAAQQGQSVQAIAATEQVSEGEVLLHLLLDKLHLEGASAEVC